MPEIKYWTQLATEQYPPRCDDAGREPGEIILQAGFSWAEDDDAALEGARVWKGTQPPEFFTDYWSVPEEMYRHAGAPRPAGRDPNVGRSNR